MSIDSLTVSTWNIQHGLDDPERDQRLARDITSPGDAIIALPDAWHQDSAESKPTDRELRQTAEDFQALGYATLSAVFQDNRRGDNATEYGFLTLIHESIPLLDSHEIRLGRRPAHHLRVDLAGIALNVISLYLDDRGEDRRLDQLKDLWPVLASIQDEPVVLMGDFNAMHRSALSAKLLRSPLVQKAAPHIKAQNYSLSRLIDMAKGTVMEDLAAKGFKDADPELQPTMPSSLPLFQLDHIMYRQGLNSARIAVDKPDRIRPTGLSDHVQVRTTIKRAD